MQKSQPGGENDETGQRQSLAALANHVHVYRGVEVYARVYISLSTKFLV